MRWTRLQVAALAALVAGLAAAAARLAYRSLDEAMALPDPPPPAAPSPQADPDPEDWGLEATERIPAAPMGPVERQHRWQTAHDRVRARPDYAELTRQELADCMRIELARYDLGRLRG